jgi:putative membrane protein
MKRYIIAVLASAGLVLGTISVFAADPNDASQNQNMPIQDQPGRAYDRAALGNPASGNLINEPAGAEPGAASVRMTAENPATFVPKAYESDEAEIRLSQLAQEKSSSDQVKMLAQRLAQDHQAHANKVQQLAQEKNIPVSNQLSAECQKSVDALSALNGASFDKHFIHDMIRDHKKAIALYNQAAEHDTDPDVKALAESTLPTLREHLQMAEHDAVIINEPAGASLSK